MSDSKEKAQLLNRLGLSDRERWMVFNELVEMTEAQREIVLRPHSDARFSSGRDFLSMGIRARLDIALGTLTNVEIACELNLLQVADLKDLQNGPLESLCQSDAFLRYLETYLYFGVRLLAGRFYPPKWWDEIAQPFLRDETYNHRSLQLPTPPDVGSIEENAAAFDRFLDLQKNDSELGSSPGTENPVAIALGFLDGYYLEEPISTPEDYDEPGELELWLRGLGPVTIERRRLRFAAIRDGLSMWVRSHGEFFLSLEGSGPSQPKITDSSKRPSGGWTVTNPIVARFALADFYWIARLLEAEVTISARVSYRDASWLHLLRFKAILDQHIDIADELRGYEELIRSVFDFACDLIQNAVELRDEQERKFFQAADYPKAGKWTKQWRTVFDRELREIEAERSIRTYSVARMPSRPQDNGKVDDHTSIRNTTDQWSERICTGTEPRNLIGLSFSGGGIRSATFNLGVLQGLQELDLLRHVDYLSTVSGGGYIGSWLAGNVRRTKHWLGKGACWDESIAHLRAYTNYLAPHTGLFSPDTWTLGASWVRNAFLIQLTVLTWLFVLLLVPFIALRLFHEFSLSYPAKGIPIQVAGHSIVAPYIGIVSALFALLVAASLAFNFRSNRVSTGKTAPSASVVSWTISIPSWAGAFFVSSMLFSVFSGTENEWTRSSNSLGFDWILKNVFHTFPFLFIFHFVALAVIGWIALSSSYKAVNERNGPLRSILAVPSAILIAFGSAAAFYLEICGILFLFSKWSTNGDRFCAMVFVFGPPLVLTAFIVSVVFFIGFTGRSSSEAQREWWTRFGAWLSLYSVGSLTLAAAAVIGPFIILLLFNHVSGWVTAFRWSVAAGWIGTVLGGLAAGKSSKTSGESKKSQSQTLQMLAKLGGVLFIVGLALLSATLMHVLLMNLASGNQSYSSLNTEVYWSILQNFSIWKLLAILAIVTVCGLIFSWFFEINVFGLNQFYRNRIVRCYLGATRWMPGLRSAQPFTKFDFEDDMPLSTLKEDYPGPLPIINCSLNLAGSSDLALNTRHSASFSLTPLHCGADRPKVGYARTGPSKLSRDCFASGVTLGQAVSISGAAASPNMGYNTSPMVAFLLTMFNVRLGWWFPNPRRWAWNAKGLRFSLYYLTRELLGTADEDRLFLNVSDGGHFENLGVYELVRRRCRVIIASDAECDECLEFGGLGNMIRICETDFGASIDIDLTSIRQQKDGQSLAHCAVGKIRYDNGSIGYLIYLKASISGDEQVGIAQYRAAHPSFPHESTSDQFFTEDQFESYRKLGMHVVQHSFRGTRDGDTPVEVAERLADVLAPRGASADSVLKHTRTLQKLWSEFRQSPALHSFLDELMRIIPPVASALSPAETGVQSSQEHAMALELIQLMEEVFMDMQLDDFWEHPDNRGWAVLFMRWARSPKFQDIWRQTHRTFGIRFEYFCAARLGLIRDNPIARV